MGSPSSSHKTAGLFHAKSWWYSEPQQVQSRTENGNWFPVTKMSHLYSLNEKKKKMVFWNSNQAELPFRFEYNLEWVKSAESISNLSELLQFLDWVLVHKASWQRIIGWEVWYDRVRGMIFSASSVDVLGQVPSPLWVSVCKTKEINQGPQRSFPAWLSRVLRNEKGVM